MAVFTCRLKGSHGGMMDGTIIQVPTNFSSPVQSDIKKVLEAQFGKRAGEAAYPGYWDIKKN